MSINANTTWKCGGCGWSNTMSRVECRHCGWHAGAPVSPMVEPFNGLTPAQAERLAMLAEECGEVVLAIGKILRHGYDSCHPDRLVPRRTNRDDLLGEMADVLAVLGGIVDAGDLDASCRQDTLGMFDEAALDARWRRKLRYTHHQGATS